jgi:response regulator NasT
MAERQVRKRKPGVAGGRVANETTEELRVLVANENEERLAAITAVVEGLGHRVIAKETTATTIARVTRDELPDVALVGLGDDPDQALELISHVVQEAACPVIALLHFQDTNYVNEAAKRGVFAYVITGGESAELQSALDITLRRFAEYHNLDGAFGRRAIIEQAKGILMERHQITSQQAFELLRRQSTDTGRKVIDIAQAVTDSHHLLPNRNAATPDAIV